MEGYKKIPNNSEDRQKIIQFVKMSLLNKVFIGRYTERRLVEPLCTYKDVIEIDQKDDEFVNTVRSVEEKLKGSFDQRFASCISGDRNEGYSILTDLSGCAFGSYWFMIKNIAVNDLTMIISIKCLRAYVIESEPLTTANLMDQWNNFDHSKFLLNIIHNIGEILTKENLVFTARFLSALFLSLAVGSYRLLELLLQFFHELNHFIKVLTPIIIAGIEALTKAFGGLLILITYMWRGESPKKYPNMQNNKLYGRYEQNSVQYYPNNSNYQNFKRYGHQNIHYNEY